MRHIHFAAHGSFAGVGGQQDRGSCVWRRTSQGRVCEKTPIWDISLGKHVYAPCCGRLQGPPMKKTSVRGLQEDTRTFGHQALSRGHWSGTHRCV